MNSHKQIVWFLLLVAGLASVRSIGLPQNAKTKKGIGITDKKTNDAALERAYGELAKAPWKAQQEKGEIATGVIVYEQDKKLYLDSQPCSQKLYYFSEPYKKDATGKKVKCGNDIFDEYQVRQK
jgi:hypothetical protein